MVAAAPRIIHSAAERLRETRSSIPLQVNHVRGRGRKFAPSPEEYELPRHYRKQALTTPASAHGGTQPAEPSLADSWLAPGQFICEFGTPSC
jgi:hypothetical protein